MNKLNLKKKIISVLNNDQQSTIKGGQEVAGTTSNSGCTGFLCCNQKPCIPLTDGGGSTCLMTNCIEGISD